MSAAAVGIARRRSAHLPRSERQVFLRAFDAARTAAAAGDSEGPWLELKHRECPAAALAGYLEGVASTRSKGVARV